ncbi:MAG: phage portal protein [Pyrinomonadaceae bacterium]
MNYLNQLYQRILNYIGGGRGVVGEQVQRFMRQAVIGRALEFYHGLVEPQLKVKPGEPDDNIYINYAEVVVEKGVSFLFGQPLIVSVGTDEDKRGEEYLERVWPQAQRDEELQEQATDGAISGDAYLKISIEPDGAPRVTVGDPNAYEMFTDPHDCSRVVMYRCTYPVTSSSGKQTYFKEETRRAEDGRTWQIDQYEGDGEKAWVQVGQGVTWNFPSAPIFHAKNLPQPKSVYGKPDLTEATLRVVAYISRLDSMCGKIVRIHSSPKPYAKNLKKQDLEWGTDGMLFLKPTGNTIDAEIGLLEMSNDISTALSLRKVLREGLAEMTGVPEVATGKVEATGQLSGVALRILYGPLLDKTAKKRLRYGRMILECVKALLAIGERLGKVPADLAVKLNWADPLPGDELEKVNVAEGKKRLGVSESTLQKELGYNPEDEREQRQFDSQDAGTKLLDAFDRGAGMGGATAGGGVVEKSADEIQKLVTAAGALIRSGFKPEAALLAVGLDPIEHTGLLPVTLQDEEALAA